MFLNISFKNTQNTRPSANTGRVTENIKEFKELFLQMHTLVFNKFNRNNTSFSKLLHGNGIFQNIITLVRINGEKKSMPIL